MTGDPVTQYFWYVSYLETVSLTLDSGISVAPWINVAPGTFGKNNKHSPLKKHIPLHQITEFKPFLWVTLFNKDVAPGKKFKN